MIPPKLIKRITNTINHYLDSRGFPNVVADYDTISGVLSFNQPTFQVAGMRFLVMVSGNLEEFLQDPVQFYSVEIFYSHPTWPMSIETTLLEIEVDRLQNFGSLI